ncbi:MAG TPA: serine/threonine-protein kinase [Candidatus Methylacidiphilales bacterium]|nr:serine/threonine-protein kinase [Candidatus Methylacidiphilales bacterium]
MSDLETGARENSAQDQWLAGRFEVRKLIGQGGLGDVYLAWDHHLNRAVAVKRVRMQHEQTDRKLLEQAWREAMTTACLQHPNIVTIFDYGIDTAGAYVVMELIEGETLEEVLMRGPLQFEDFLRFTQQTLDAVIAAHALGLIHRDLKPGNFMITRSPFSSRFHVKILDFGLAKYLDIPQPQSIDHFNSLMGSIHYMAPEQFQRQPIGQRTDLYSLGCIFYEALTGHPAYDGANVSELIDAHLKRAPFPMKDLRKDISPKLEQWVMRFLEKDPAARTQSAVNALRTLPTLEECRLDTRHTSGSLLGKLVHRPPST